MIGNLVCKSTPPRKRRTLAYTPRWRKDRVVKPRVARDTGQVSAERWLRGPYQFPVAKLYQAPTLASDLRGWLDEKWAWLRPRSIPVVVALLGMVMLIAATNYLQEMAHPKAAVMSKPRAGVLVYAPDGPRVVDRATFFRQ